MYQRLLIYLRAGREKGVFSTFSEYSPKIFWKKDVKEGKIEEKGDREEEGWGRGRKRKFLWV